MCSNCENGETKPPECVGGFRVALLHDQPSVPLILADWDCPNPPVVMVVVESVGKMFPYCRTCLAREEAREKVMTATASMN